MNAIGDLGYNKLTIDRVQSEQVKFEQLVEQSKLEREELRKKLNMKNIENIDISERVLDIQKRLAKASLDRDRQAENFKEKVVKLDAEYKEAKEIKRSCLLEVNIV